MYGNGHEMETLESLLEDIEGFESDESDESDEARRRSRRGGGGGRFPLRTATGTGLASPRPNNQYVTQTQLQTSLAKVGEQLKANSNAIGGLSDRVSAQTEVIRKEVAARRKETDQLKKDLNQTRQMSALLPLLSKPKTVQLQASAVPIGTSPLPKALVDSDDGFGLLLPLMLMGGMGGSSGGSGGGGMFGGDDSGMMMMMLALTLGKK